MEPNTSEHRVRTKEQCGDAEILTLRDRLVSNIVLGMWDECYT